MPRVGAGLVERRERGRCEENESERMEVGEEDRRREASISRTLSSSLAKLCLGSHLPPPEALHSEEERQRG
jgi:hypothetical protein